MGEVLLYKGVLPLDLVRAYMDEVATFVSHDLEVRFVLDNGCQESIRYMIITFY